LKTSRNNLLKAEVVALSLAEPLDADNITLARFKGKPKLIREVQLRHFAWVHAFKLHSWLPIVKEEHSFTKVANRDRQQKLFNLIFESALTSKYLANFLRLKFEYLLGVGGQVVDL
jgi:hypothetical protein